MKNENGHSIRQLARMTGCDRATIDKVIGWGIQPVRVAGKIQYYPFNEVHEALLEISPAYEQRVKYQMLHRLREMQEHVEDPPQSG